MGIFLTFASGFVVVAVLGFVLHRRGTTTDEASGRKNLQKARWDTTYLTGGRLPSGEEPPPR
jgi:hypothetical protein